MGAPPLASHIWDSRPRIGDDISPAIRILFAKDWAIDKGKPLGPERNHIHITDSINAIRTKRFPSSPTSRAKERGHIVTSGRLVPSSSAKSYSEPRFDPANNSKTLCIVCCVMKFPGREGISLTHSGRQYGDNIVREGAFYYRRPPLWEGSPITLFDAPKRRLLYKRG